MQTTASMSRATPSFRSSKTTAPASISGPPPNSFLDAAAKRRRVGDRRRRRVRNRSQRTIRTATRRLRTHLGQNSLTTRHCVHLDPLRRRLHHHHHRCGPILMAAGHGGQMLVSQASAEMLGRDVDLTELGEHRLRDLTAPLRVWQVGRASFQPLRTLDPCRGCR